MAKIYIGISGWRYPVWRGKFYPAGLPQRRELAFAAHHFNSIELNGPFYSLQRPEFYRAWADETPSDFVFAIKGSRFITHMKKLRDVEVALSNFFASGLLCLGRKIGPILWQFPETLGFNDSRFADFFELLPRNLHEAAELARRHDARVEDRAYIEPAVNAGLRHAVEVRHRSFQSPDFVRLLRRQRIALVVADTAQRWPYFEDVTADFVYVRLHGDTELYKSGYSAHAIADWAARVRAWQHGNDPEDAVLVAPPITGTRARDVYIYFDNDVKVHAPFDALALGRELGLPGRAYDARAFETKARSSGGGRRRSA